MLEYIKWFCTCTEANVVPCLINWHWLFAKCIISLLQICSLHICEDIGHRFANCRIIFFSLGYDLYGSYTNKRIWFQQVFCLTWCVNTPTFIWRCNIVLTLLIPTHSSTKSFWNSSQHKLVVVIWPFYLEVTGYTIHSFHFICLHFGMWVIYCISIQNLALTPQTMCCPL